MKTWTVREDLQKGAVVAEVGGDLVLANPARSPKITPRPMGLAMRDLPAGEQATEGVDVVPFPG
jgi:hypothetical protein